MEVLPSAYGQATASSASVAASSPAAFTSGSGAIKAIMPNTTKIPTIIPNGWNKSSIFIWSMVLPITKVIKRVVAGQASLLQIPMMEIRFAADSIGPRIVTYGFTEAWSTALAAPQMNEAKRNHTIDSVAAAWMNNPKAIAKMMNERAIVFL